MTTDRADEGDDVAKASLNRVRATTGGSSIDPPLSMLVLHGWSVGELPDRPLQEGFDEAALADEEYE
jgi:hypothetical protein